MAIDTTSIREEIIAVVEAAGDFSYGTFDEQPLAAQQASGLGVDHTFNVVFGRLARHPSTYARVANTRLANLDVTLVFRTRVPTTVQESARSTVLAVISTDLTAALRALCQPGAIDSDEVVAGMLLGPDGLGHPELGEMQADWETHLIRTEVTGTLVLKLSTATELNHLTWRGDPLTWRGELITRT